jgi:Zn2+/Cd2+-exporting ATPase
MTHKHKYDAQGKQLCCTQQEKIYNNAGAAALLNEEHSKDNGHNRVEHTEHDGHDHSSSNDSTIKMFLPSVISFGAIAHSHSHRQLLSTNLVHRLD